MSNTETIDLKRDDVISVLLSRETSEADCDFLRDSTLRGRSGDPFVRMVYTPRLGNLIEKLRIRRAL